MKCFNIFRVTHCQRVYFCFVDRSTTTPHGSEMTFSNRITRSPTAHDRDHGQAAVQALAVTGPLADVVAGAAGCSPYLNTLMTREAAWIAAAFDAPEVAVEDEFARLRDVPLSDLEVQLRLAKRRIALLTALADLGGVWDLAQVTRVLTDFADLTVDVSLRRLVTAEVARGKLPGGAGDTAGIAVIAMGKMGAFELNYSSDIDLICLYDEQHYQGHDLGEIGPALVRIVRRMAQILSKVTGEGYVFRTDLRLRPDASVTPVCLSMAAAEAYYAGVGRTWERAAYIKARACAGDVAAGARFLQALTPFVWRKHLDFAAIQDAHDMRLKIRDHKGLGGALRLDGHDMKLGQGGIREIEFFTQTRQLIAGGRDPSLRVRGTVEGLARLAEAGWITPEIATGLTDRYRRHREVEHRLQMINDAQTHDLPTSDEGFARLAAFMGADVSSFQTALTADLVQVRDWTEDFFAPDEADADVSGFGAETTARWPSYPALRSDRAAAIFERLRPEILTRLQEATRPDEALANFDRFLAGQPAGVQLFSLFEANPQLTQLIVDVCATAPALADHLARNAGVLDAVIGGTFFADWPGQTGLHDDLVSDLARATDYEAALDHARRWMKEWHFRVGVHHLRGLITAEEAGAQYADVAEAVVAALWPVVTEHFAQKHGAAPGRGAVVVAMGSLGARRLNAASDLDLIVIYDGQEVETSDGPRPLPTRVYYARLTQAMITALSAPMAEGRLYEVDMRLRPSGRQGPVATGLHSFETYQRDEAWTWEHLALTRARVVAGPDDVTTDIEAVRQAILRDKAAGAGVRADVQDMRDRLTAARPGAGGLDVKAGYGRLQDVDLGVQTLALLAGSDARGGTSQVAAGVAAGLISDAQGQDLNEALGLYWRVQAAMRLLHGDTGGAGDMSEGGRQMLWRETDATGIDALEQQLSDTAQAAGAIVDRVLRVTA